MLNRLMIAAALLLALIPATHAFTASEQRLEAAPVTPRMDLLPVAGYIEGLESLENDVQAIRGTYEGASPNEILTYAPGLIHQFTGRATDMRDARQFWYRFRLHNNTNETAFLNLQLQLRRNNQFEVFVIGPDDSVLQHKLIDLGMPVADREIKYGNGDIMALTIPPGEAMVYIRLLNTGRLIPALVSSANWFNDQTNDMVMFGLLGVVAGLVLYNGLLLGATRDLAYVYYVLFLLMIGTMVVMQRMMYELWPPDFDQTAWQTAFAFATAGYGVFQLLFTRELLRTRQVARWTEWIYWPMILLILASSITQLFAVIAALAFTAGAVNLILVAVLARRGVPQAGIFVVAFAVATPTNFAFMASLLLGSNIDPWYADFLTNIGLPASQVFEMSLLAFALAARIRRRETETIEAQAATLEAETERERSQAEALEVANEASERLEQAVADRTHELQDAIDDLETSQAQIVRTEKLAAIGQLVAGVAHELNTPLGYLRANLDFLREMLSKGSTFLQGFGKLTKAAREGSSDEQLAAEYAAIQASGEALGREGFSTQAGDMVADAEFGLDHIDSIVRSLKRMSHVEDDEDEHVPYRLEEALDSAVTLSNNLHRGRVVIERDYDEAVPPVQCVPGNINQMFLNLISNAVQAVKDEEQPRIDLRTRLDGDFAVVEVQDNGCGMPEEVKEKIFDPFFTTKRVGEGTGLGLAISWSILQAHHATVHVDSTEGEGTTFVLRFPLEPAQPSGASEEAQPLARSA